MWDMNLEWRCLKLSIRCRLRRIVIETRLKGLCAVLKGIPSKSMPATLHLPCPDSAAEPWLPLYPRNFATSISMLSWVSP
ncbi:Protein of unknown function [Pyronema omphalodes CBS 100304]|uniref:Uncharacterized protein n=1 Tax=Pyronema omphalodes (strain CBS 100304) TaxID=1076935 RepID=U4LK86_PYROM|nr:Protein of unknown function [Pyronema omphalodes CBS 100304]